jgi:ubiquinone/menaquinone biosynthesis C-methylase UbiE
MRLLLRLFFALLYHQFAWTYDLVAATVSLGRWKTWVLSAVPHLHGRILEIGCGPGHLQLALRSRGLAAFGLDESPQMTRLASRRLLRQGLSPGITRGLAQRLPYPSATFDCVVATFPSEYFFDGRTLTAIRRVLKPEGQLVLIPAAWITGLSLLNRLAAWLFQVTGQAGPLELLLPPITRQLRSAGFSVRHEVNELPGTRVLVILASRA